MNTKDDIIFDVKLDEPKETVTFVNISYEKIQEAMRDAFNNTKALQIEADNVTKEQFLHELANQLNKKGNTISWRGKTMKMNFSLE